MLVAATPRGLPEPGSPPTPEKTLSRWGQFLGSIAAGVLLPDAMLRHYISRADIEAAIRSSPEERQRWDEARIAALKYGWSAFDFEDIFERIAGGMTISAALAEVKGQGGSIYSAFNRIIISDSILNEQYMMALKSRALVMQEEIIELADNDSNDVIVNDKGPAPNNAAVNRSKLQVETRTRLMSAWHTKMFGEQKNQVQVNVQVNHAERLEAARSRANSRSGVPKISKAVVEATFREVVPADTKPIPPVPRPDHAAEAARIMAEREANDMSWLDEPVKEPALDTLWLEQ